MAEGHGRDAWARASLQMALIANCNRDPRKGRAFKPDDFSPYKTEPLVKALTPESLGKLRAAFGGGKKKRK